MNFQALKEKELSNKIVYKALVLLFILSLLPLFMIAGYNHACADDFVYAAKTFHTWNQTQSITAVLQTAIDVAKEYYVNWQGTFTSIFLMSIQPAIFGEAYYAIVPFIMLGMLIGSTVFFLNIIFGNYFQADRYQRGIIISIILLLSIQLMEEPVSAFYWYNGSVHYMFMYSLMLLMLGLQFLMIKEINLKKIILFVTISSFLGFTIGGGNYVIGLTAILGLLTALGICSLYKQYKRLVFLLIPTVIYCITFAVNAVAPGNSVRSGYFTDTPGAASSVLQSFFYALEYIREWMDWPVVLAVLFIIPIAWQIAGKTNFTFSKPLLIIAYGFCFVSAMFAPTIYTMNHVGPGRSRNVIYLVFILLLFISVMYTVGWVAKQDIIHLKKQGSVTAMSAIFLIVISVVAAGLGGITILQDIHRFTSVSALNSMRIGEAQVYSSEAYERLNILKDDTVKDVILEPFTYYPHVLFFDDVQEDSSEWQNTGMAEYFEKDTVTRRKP